MESTQPNFVQTKNISLKEVLYELEKENKKLEKENTELKKLASEFIFHTDNYEERQAKIALNKLANYLRDVGY